MLHTFWQHFLNTSPVKTGHMPPFSKTAQHLTLPANCMHCLESFGDNNKQGIVVFSFTRSEAVQFLFVGHVKGQRVW